MNNIRIGVIGAGFWAKYQIAAWKRVRGAEVSAIWNRTAGKAEVLAAEMDIPTVASTAEELVTIPRIDVIDIITSEETHRDFALLAADSRRHVICQKPMASSFEACREMVDKAEHAGVRLFIHDNWRYQQPIRRFLERYRERPVGNAVRGRFSYLSSFPVFELQPFLKEAERFMLMDMGTHIIDTARAFMGDFTTVAAHTARVTPGIAGEDLATLLAETVSGAHCTIELSYASPTEHEHELETVIVLECEHGVMELDHDSRMTVTTHGGRTTAERVTSETPDWVIPRYCLSMQSCLPANESFRDALLEDSPCETEGRSYLNTMETVFAAYEAAQSRSTVRLETGGRP